VFKKVGGLRQQMKELEDQNSQYLDKVLDMESTIKTIPGMVKSENTLLSTNFAEQISFLYHFQPQ
jgi:hypothetical protein